jgi:hypothetical protein
MASPSHDPLSRMGASSVFCSIQRGIERLSDILSEYKIPFQLGIDTSETTHLTLPNVPIWRGQWQARIW